MKTNETRQNKNKIMFGSSVQNKMIVFVSYLVDDG
jgi:hypothetical protein